MEEKKIIEKPSLAVIILNWNGWRHTIACLESLYQSTYTNFIALVVDNGSRDDSVKKIRSWAAGDLPAQLNLFTYTSENKPIPIELVSAGQALTDNAELRPAAQSLILIENNENTGFAKGNNIGIKFLLQYENIKNFFLLNNDTEISPTCLEKLISAAELEKKAAAFQPKMLSMEDPTLIDAAGISINNTYGGASQYGCGEKDGEAFSRVFEIFGVSGGAALLRREMLVDIGLFDEDFFAYYEDVDLALRAQLRGWKSLFVPEAVVYHAHSSTLGKESPLKIFLLERNRYYYTIKNMPLALVQRFLLNRPRFIVGSMLRYILDKKFTAAKYFLKGNLAPLVSIIRVIQKRKKIRSFQIVPEKNLRAKFDK